jgi:hypothetical protein
MEQKDIWRDFEELSQEAQQQVIDFIAALKTRYSKTRPARKGKLRKLEDEPFIGMWRDREDMRDSSAWVRDLRKKEWRETTG